MEIAEFLAASHGKSISIADMKSIFLLYSVGIAASALAFVREILAFFIMILLKWVVIDIPTKILIVVKKLLFKLIT